MPAESNEIALVLSGGVARGVFHIGVYQALIDYQIYPQIISGTSAGGIIGAFIAKGFTPDEIKELSKKTDIVSISAFHPGNLGLFNPQSIERTLQKYLGRIAFDDLQCELIVTATDIYTGEPVYIRQGPLIPALLATSAIPIVYKPVSLNGRLLIDGGISNNFPVEPVNNGKYKIIGCHANPVLTLEGELDYMALVDRCVSIVLHKDIKHKAKKCDIFIEPPLLSNYGMFQMKKAEEIIEVGYQYTKSLKESFEKIIS